MKKKIFTILITAALLGTVMTACGKKDEAEVKEPEATPTEAPAETEAPAQEPEKTPETAAEGLSDDLYSFQIQLNDVVYVMPSSLSEFVENGWEIEEDGELEPNQRTMSIVAGNGEARVYFQLVNTEANVLPFAECRVGAVSVDTHQAEEGAAIVLPKNIAIGSNYEEVIEAYGEASDLYDSDTRKVLTYSPEVYSEVGITVDAETNKVSSIEVENLNAQEKADSPKELN